MNIQKAFTILFDDKDWLKKMLFGGLFSFLAWFLIGIPFLMGYFLRMVKRGKAGEFIPLPEWDDFGGLFKEGLIFSLVLIVYGIIFFAVSAVLQIIPCLGCIIGTLIFLLFPLIMPYLTLKYIETENFGSCFNFSEMFQHVQKNLQNLIIYVLIVIALSMISSLVGSLLLLIGVIFTNFWFLVGNAYLVVEVDRNAK